MKILLTGGTGFIGLHLLKLLLSRGHDVVALKRKTSKNVCTEDGYPKLRWHEIDDNLAQLFNAERFDAVVHLATVYGRKGEDLGSLIEANVVFPLRLLQYSCQAGCRKFLHTDTFYTASNHQYNYLREYILSKKHLSEWCLIFAKNHPELTIFNVRLQHVYGPLDGKEKFIPHLIQRMLENVSHLDLTSGEQLRDFIFVTDVADAYATLLEMENAQPGYQEVGVGTGSSVSVRNIVERIKSLTRSSSLLNFGVLPLREGEIMKSEADIAFLIQNHWSPKIDLETGLLQTINSFNIGDVS